MIVPNPEHWNRITTLGQLKEHIKRVEAAGANDDTQVWASGLIEMSGEKDDLMDEIQVGGTELLVNKDWKPNFGPVILFYNAKYEIPDPDDMPCI